MIIGMALKKIFESKTIKVGLDDVSVQFHFGDQKEFNYWLVNRKAQKYPLIWYVINAPEPLGDGKLKVDSQLLLFMLNEKVSMFNDVRYGYTYQKYLEPLYELVNKTLKEHKHVTLISNKPLGYKDEPFYGIDINNPNNSSNDFSSKSIKGTKSVGVDIVDAKIVRLKMEITPKCII